MSIENQTQEELAAEQAAIQVPKEEEVRAEIIAEFGFDENTDGEKIDKLVAKQMEGKKMLSKTIAQKIKHRSEADELRKKVNSVTTQQPEVKSDLSSKDILALSKANISEEDMDEVIEYAKFKKISISDALKSNVIKSSIKEKEEQRKTAAVTNTAPARRGSTKVSDEEIVEKSRTGEVPEDPAVLAQARFNLKKQKKN